ncbi:MAG: phosphomannomutase/phosphoglucomutase [Bacilli bacterium]|nr:phosphomannomutase/phosphoglucomutase [Bacilli bacterium]
MKINTAIFREYDIRGIYGTDIDPEVAYTIGKGFGSYVSKMGYDKVIIGYDNRHSSPLIFDTLSKGILSTGVDVTSIGLVTTPMYYFARKHLGFTAGIMITASHNPKEYNGFKIAFSNIGNAYGKAIIDFRDFVIKGDFQSGNGIITKQDIKQDYLKLIKESTNIGSKKIKVVVDCGNGTGSIIVNDILKQLNIEYYLLYCDSDGDFPNHHPDPSVKSNMIDLKNKVLELNYDLGIGIDGDADRVGIVDEKGNILSADMHMLIIYRLLAPILKDKKALFDVKCSKSLIDELEKLGYHSTMYRTGNSYINMMMQKGDFVFGGEYSGHIYYRDKFPGYDDGIYNGIRLIEQLSHINKPLSSLLDGINKYYATDEIKFLTTDENKFKIVEEIKKYCLDKYYSFIDIDGVRAQFEDGWALVRASNTGPNLTARFEAKTKERLDEITEEFTNLINSLI